MAQLRIIYTGSGIGFGANACICVVDTQTGSIVEGSLREDIGCVGNAHSNSNVSFAHTNALKPTSSIGYAMGFDGRNLHICSNAHINDDRRDGPATGLAVYFPANMAPDDMGKVIDLIHGLTSDIQKITANPETRTVKSILRADAFGQIVQSHTGKIVQISLSPKKIIKDGGSSYYKNAYVVPDITGEDRESYQRAVNEAVVKVFSQSLQCPVLMGDAVMSPSQKELLTKQGTFKIHTYERTSAPSHEPPASPPIVARVPAGAVTPDDNTRDEFSLAATELVARQVSEGLGFLLRISKDQGPHGNAARKAIEQIQKTLALPSQDCS